MATKWVDRVTLFASARLKLTLFYLSIIFIFNLAVSLGVRVIAEQEYLRASYGVRTEVKEWGIRVWRLADMDDPSVALADVQHAQAEIVRDHLNKGLFWINVAALGLGGLLSYWFAGRALRPIEEAHEAQARFTADASHELRTPLTNMKLENEVFLRQKTFTPEEAREQVASNLEEVQRLERLSNNMLALHQYGSTALTRTPVSIQKVIKTAVAQVENTARAKGVTISQEVASGKVLAHFDSLVQLMDILLDNALKYGASGKQVTIRGRMQAGQYVLQVSDRGPGIAEQDLPRIFDRLYRGDKARSSSMAGYGLGLALAREIAHANAAGISARNNPDKGACFTITLERSRAQTATKADLV